MYYILIIMARFKNEIEPFLILAALHTGNASRQHSLFRRNVAAVTSRGQHCARITGLRFEPQTSRFSNERVIAQRTGRFSELYSNLSLRSPRFFVNLLKCRHFDYGIFQ